MWREGQQPALKDLCVWGGGVWGLYGLIGTITGNPAPRGCPIVSSELIVQKESFPTLISGHNSSSLARRSH